MATRVLITGGAGFIGSYVSEELLEHGYRVRILDALHPQVHGREARWPEYLDPRCELVCADVRNRPAVRRALRGVDAVVHLAARVGVGQSMYEVESYTAANNLGTAILLEEMVDLKVNRLVVASSMSVYGEGLYRSKDGAIHDTVVRSQDQLRRHQWEPLSESGEPLEPYPTAESKPPSLASVYALSKYDQEVLCLLLGRSYGIPTLALRLFNVYGPRQALSNPYTGVLAVFACRLLNGQSPRIYEDGLQCRDFVSVHDVARAFRLALEKREVAGEVLNIGSSRRFRIIDIARQLAYALGRKTAPEVTHQYRAGDIRHCFADIRKAGAMLAYRPLVSLEEGMVELGSWLEGQTAMDRADDAAAELTSRGLAR